MTAAVVRLFPLPEVKEYGSVLFPDFEAGVSFLYDLQRGRGHQGGYQVGDETSPPARQARLNDGERPRALPPVNY